MRRSLLPRLFGITTFLPVFQLTRWMFPHAVPKEGKPVSRHLLISSWHRMSKAVDKNARVAGWMNRAASLLLLLSVFWMVAAASFAGSAGKWGLRDVDERHGVYKMLDGTAHRPFVYRQLVPSIVNYADQIAPASIKEAFLNGNHPDQVFVRMAAVQDPAYHFRYLAVYYLSFLALYASLFVLRQIVLDAGASRLAAVLVPASFALAFPYIQTIGGYFYDSVELLFLGLTFLAVSRGRIALFLLLVFPATLNKETFFFFIPALYPLLRQHYGVAKSCCVTGVGILLSGVVNVWVKSLYAGAPGTPAEIHLFENLRLYTQPWLYRQFEMTYGLVGPSSIALPTLLIVLVIFLRAWPYCTQAVRRHIQIAACINLPLLVAFAAPGELRNLSLLFIGLVILMGHAIETERKPVPTETGLLPASLDPAVPGEQSAAKLAA